MIDKFLGIIIIIIVFIGLAILSTSIPLNAKSKERNNDIIPYADIRLYIGKDVIFSWNDCENVIVIAPFIHITHEGIEKRLSIFGNWEIIPTNKIKKGS